MNESPSITRTDASDRVTDDLSCIECGYNLRSLQPDAQCPECGRAVADTLRFVGRFGSIGWYEQVRRGLLILTISLGVCFVGVLFSPLMLAGMIGALVGAWQVTRPPPAGRVAFDARWGIFARWALTGGMILSITGPVAFYLMLFTGAGFPSELTLSALFAPGHFIGAFGIVCLGRHLAIFSWCFLRGAYASQAALASFAHLLVIIVTWAMLFRLAVLSSANSDADFDPILYGFLALGAAALAVWVWTLVILILLYARLTRCRRDPDA